MSWRTVEGKGNLVLAGGGMFLVLLLELEILNPTKHYQALDFFSFVFRAFQFLSFDTWPFLAPVVLLEKISP